MRSTKYEKTGFQAKQPDILPATIGSAMYDSEVIPATNGMRRIEVATS